MNKARLRTDIAHAIEYLRKARPDLSDKEIIQLFATLPVDFFARFEEGGQSFDTVPINSPI